MTLDAAISHEKELAKEVYIEAMLCHANPDDGKLDACIEGGRYHEQLATWLEDYKHIKQWKSDIMDSFCKYDVNSFEELVANTRTKALNDFVNVCEKQFTTMYGQRYVDMRDIKELAEQLKVGITND